MTHIGLVTEDGRKLLLDFPAQFKQDYAQFAGHEVELELRKRRAKRTLKQNAYLHAAIKPFADHLGYLVPELKQALLCELYGYHTVAGQEVPNRMHTSDLNTQEFVELTELMIQRAAENNVLILYPDEFKAARKKAAKRLPRN